MIPQQAINIERHLVQNILYHLEKCHDIQKHQVTEDVLIYIYIPVSRHIMHTCHVSQPAAFMSECLNCY